MANDGFNFKIGPVENWCMHSEAELSVESYAGNIQLCSIPNIDKDKKP